MSEAKPSSGQWRISARDCGCGAVRLHTFTDDMPFVTIVFSARQAITLAGQLVDAADSVAAEAEKPEGKACH